MTEPKRQLLSEGWPRPAAVYLAAFLTFWLGSPEEDGWAAWVGRHGRLHGGRAGTRDTTRGGVHNMDPLVCGPRELEHLSELPARGLHVLTVADGATNVCGPGQDTFDVTLFVDGTAAAPATVALSCDPTLSAEMWLMGSLRRLVQRQRPKVYAQLRRESLLQDTNHAKERSRAPPARAWKLFSPFGSALSADVAQLLDTFRECRTIYVYEGGAFVWPGVRPGYTVVIPTGDPELPNTTITTLSLVPRVFAVEPLLTHTEAAAIIRNAGSKMGTSKVQGVGAQTDEARTSTQIRMLKGADGGGNGATRMETRAQAVLHISESHNEQLEVLRYRAGEKYKAHYDFFRREKFTCDIDARTTRMLTNEFGGERNRLATMLWYLTSHPDGGGETHFPLAVVEGGPPALVADEECGGVGLKITPVTGKVALWYNLRPDGAIDSFSKHAGCSPQEDEIKWAMNMWSWTDPIGRSDRE